MIMMLNIVSRKHSLILLRKWCLRYHSRCIQAKPYSKNSVDYTTPAGIPGSGVGKGGGGGGTVRQSGGGLGRLGAAQEEGYFHQQQREQIRKLKEKLKRGEEIGFAPKSKP